MSEKPPVVNVSGISKELNYDFIDLSLCDERMTLRLADTEQKRYKGLSGVTKLEKNEGMLFSYPTEKRHRLVMRDMEIPLDVIHVGGDGKVNSYGSMSEDGEAVEGVSKWSIELPHGWCEKNGVQEGDPVYIKEPEGKEKINKGRRYVESPNDIPEEYEIQEGPQGGIYYETGNDDTADIPVSQDDLNELVEGSNFVQTDGANVDWLGHTTSKPTLVVDYGEGPTIIPSPAGGWEKNGETMWLLETEGGEEELHIPEKDIEVLGTVKPKRDEFGRLINPMTAEVEEPAPNEEFDRTPLDKDSFGDWHEDREVAGEVFDSVQDRIREAYPDKEVYGEVWGELEDWKTKGYNARTPVWAAAMAMSDEEVIPEHLTEYMNHGVDDVDPEVLSAFCELSRLSKETVREEFGDNFTVYRAIDGDTFRQYAKRNEDGSVTIKPQVLESWSHDRSGAKGWANHKFTDSHTGSDYVFLEKEFTPEDVGFFGPITLGKVNESYKEITMSPQDDTYTIPADQVDETYLQEKAADEMTEPPRMPSSASDWMFTVKPENFQTEKEKVLKSLEAAFKGRRYVEDPSDAPDDVEVQEGPQGGHYYETEGSAPQGPTMPEGVSSVFDQGIDINETKEGLGGTVISLDEEESEELKEVLAENHGEEVFDGIFDLYESWKGSSSGSEARLREMGFMYAADVDGQPRPAEEEVSVSEEQIEISRDIQKASQEFVSEHYADDDGNVELHRGLSTTVGHGIIETVFKSFSQGETVDEYEFEMFPMANYSVSESVGERFGKNSAYISEKVSVDNILTAEELLYSGSGSESEISVVGNDRNLPSEQVKIGSNWTADQLLENPEQNDDEDWRSILKTCKSVVNLNKLERNKAERNDEEPDYTYDSEVVESVLGIFELMEEHTSVEEISEQGHSPPGPGDRVVGFTEDKINTVREEARDLVTDMDKNDELGKITPKFNLRTEENANWSKRSAKEKILSDVVAKTRRYVEDPSDAPDDVEVQEGPQGGHFYETEGGETQPEEGSEESEEAEGLPEYDTDDPQWVEVDESDVDVGDVVMVWDDDEWERSVATVTDTGGMSVTVEYESGETDTIDQLGLFEDLSIQSQFVEGRTEEEAEAEEDPFHDKPWDSEEEREQILEEQKEERLEAVDYYDIPDPESGESSGVNIPTEAIGNQEPNDFGTRAEEEDVQTLEETIENGSLGEELGVNVNISEIPDDTPFGDSDFGKPNQDDPYVDVAIDTEDYLNLQFELQHKYFPSEQDYEEHRRNFFGNVRVDDIEEYAETLREEPGEMDYPYMFTRNDGSVGSAQEGRHRALAAWKAGVDKIPVRVILDSDKEPSEKMVDKARRYVEDPSEVPEEYEVQEGPQGGTYYETGGEESEEATEGGESEWQELPDDFDDWESVEGMEMEVGGETYTIDELRDEEALDFVSVEEPLTGDEPGYIGGIEAEGIATAVINEVREPTGQTTGGADMDIDEDEWSDPPDQIQDLNEGQKVLVDTGRPQVATVNWAAEDIASVFLDESGEPWDVTDTDDVLGVSGEGHETRVTAEEADDPTEMIDSIPFYGDAERLEGRVKDSIRRNSTNIKDEETAKKVLDHIDQFESMPGRAHIDTASGTSKDRAPFNVGTSGNEDTINHEFGHVTADTFGYGLAGTMAAREAMNEYDPEEDNFIDLDPEAESHLLEQKGDQEEPTPEIQRLVAEVNDGWKRLQENGAEEADRYNIKSNYSSANAHEFMAELNETLQHETKVMPQGEVSWFDNHPGLLNAYLDVFEPSDSMKKVISGLHHDRGDDSPFDEDPFKSDNKSAKSVRKRRVYVQDPSEVPEQYDLQEGPQGGTYYETEPEAEEEEVDDVELPDEAEDGEPPDPEDFEDIDPEDLRNGELVWVKDGDDVVLAEAQDEGTGWKAYPVKEGDERGLSLTGLGAYDVVGRGTEEDELAIRGIDFSDNAFYDMPEGEKIIYEDEDGNEREGEIMRVGPRGQWAKVVEPGGLEDDIPIAQNVEGDQLIGTWEEVMGGEDEVSFDELDLGDEIVFEDHYGDTQVAEVSNLWEDSDRENITAIGEDGMEFAVFPEDFESVAEDLDDVDIAAGDLTGSEILMEHGEKGYVINGEDNSLHVEILTGPNSGEDIFGISREEVDDVIEMPDVDIDDTHEPIDFNDVDTDEWVQDKSWPNQSIQVYDRVDGEMKEGFIHRDNFKRHAGKAEGQIIDGGEDGRFRIGNSNRFEVVSAESFDEIDREGKIDALNHMVQNSDKRSIGHSTASKFESEVLGSGYDERRLGSLTRATDFDTAHRVARGMDYLKNKVSRASCGGSASKGTWHISISEDESNETINHELGHAIATSFGFDYIGENQNEEYGPRMLSHNYTQYSDTGSWSGFIDWDLGEDSDFYDVEEYMFSWFDDASDGTVQNEYAVGFDDFKEAVDQEVEETYNEEGLILESWQDAQYEEPDEDASALQVFDSLEDGDLVRFNVPDWDAGRDEDGNPVATKTDVAQFKRVEEQEASDHQKAVFERPNGDEWLWPTGSDGELYSDWSSVDAVSSDPNVSGDEDEDDTDSGSGGIPQDPESVTEYLGYKYEGGFNPDAETPEEKMGNLARAVNRAFYKQAKVHDATEDHTDRQKVVMETGYSATNAHETIAQLHEVLQTPTESNKERANDIFDEHPYLMLAYMDMWEPSPEMMEEMEALLQALGIEL